MFLKVEGKGRERARQKMETNAMWLPKPRLCCALFGVALLHAAFAHAQWDQRTITLNPGWNAVFMALQPEPNDPAAVFSGLPIESVWSWTSSDSEVQFIQDATNLRPTLPNWTVYVPAGKPEANLTNLFAIFSGQAYLINVSGAVPVQWVIQGKVENEAIEWAANSPNLVGFGVDPAAPPTFADFFRPSKAHAGQPVFFLKSDGLWAQVVSPETDTLSPNAAYWVVTQGTSDYQGPLTAEFSFGPDITFGETLNSATIVFDNLSNFDRTVVLSTGSSGVPPTPDSLANLGDIPLGYLRDDLPFEQRVFDAFIAPVTVLVPANSRGGVTLEVRRGEMADPVFPPGFTDGNYQGLLFVKDDKGTSLIRGMTSDGLTDAASVAKAINKGVTPSGPRTGLWVGNVQIDAVSQPTADPPILDPVPVTPGHEFEYRLLLHVDGAGIVRLLSHVTLMRHSSKLIEVPNTQTTLRGATITVIDENQAGYDVLITNDVFFNAIRADDGRPFYEGIQFRGDTPVGRRFMSTGFHLFRDDPNNALKGPGWIRLLGGFPTPTFEDNVFTVTTTDSSGNDLLVLPFDDPFNPFVHQFHPAHDNLNAEFLPFEDGRFPADAPGENIESYTITRRITLNFTKADPFGLNLAGYGGNILGGVFEEEISGIFAQEIPNPIPQGEPPFIVPPLKLSGSFRIERVFQVPDLNDPDAQVNDPDAFP